MKIRIKKYLSYSAILASPFIMLSCDEAGDTNITTASDEIEAPSLGELITSEEIFEALIGSSPLSLEITSVSSDTIDVNCFGPDRFGLFIDGADSTGIITISPIGAEYSGITATDNTLTIPTVTSEFLATDSLTDIVVTAPAATINLDNGDTRYLGSFTATFTQGAVENAPVPSTTDIDHTGTFTFFNVIPDSTGDTGVNGRNSNDFSVTSITVDGITFEVASGDVIFQTFNFNGDNTTGFTYVIDQSSITSVDLTTAVDHNIATDIDVSVGNVIRLVSSRAEDEIVDLAGRFEWNVNRVTVFE